MLTGTVPFKAANLQDLHKLILEGEFSIPDFVSSNAKDMLRNMIKLEPKERLTVP
jgi:serine/threonine protein kinase